MAFQLWDTAVLARQAAPLPVALAVLPPVRAFVSFVPQLETLDIGPTAVTIPFSWGRLAGVDAAELPRTTLTLAPASAGDTYRGISLGHLPSRIENGQLIIEVPNGRRIRALHITALTTTEVVPVALVDATGLAGRQLSVSVADASGAFASPLVCVPPVAARGQIPPTLTGGAFRNSVLTLPDISGRTLRIALVRGGTPDNFTVIGITAGVVSGWAAPIPQDLTVTGPNEAVLWRFPGEFLPGSAPAQVDVTVGLQSALQGLLASDSALDGELTITARYPARIHIGRPAIRGSLLRNLAGTSKVELAGSPVSVPIAGGTLPALEPSSVVGDVRVVYAGIRVAEISDLLPVGRAVSGVVVGSETRVRVLPPQALRGQRVARLAVIGRAVGAVDLTVQLFDASRSSQTERPALAAAQVISFVPAAANGDGGEIGVFWVELDEPVEISGPIGVALTATRGSFLWVADPEPLIRIAVVDPDPGGRPILLAGRTLLTLDGPELSVQRAVLPGTAFGGGQAELRFASALYCRIELTDLELRYARPGQDTVVV